MEELVHLQTLLILIPEAILVAPFASELLHTKMWQFSIKQTPHYSRHFFKVPTVSALERIHCILKKTWDGVSPWRGGTVPIPLGLKLLATW